MESKARFEDDEAAARVIGATLGGILFGGVTFGTPGAIVMGLIAAVMSAIRNDELAHGRPQRAVRKHS